MMHIVCISIYKKSGTVYIICREKNWLKLQQRLGENSQTGQYHDESLNQHLKQIN